LEVQWEARWGVGRWGPHPEWGLREWEGWGQVLSFFLTLFSGDVFFSNGMGVGFGQRKEFSVVCFCRAEAGIQQYHEHQSTLPPAR